MASVINILKMVKVMSFGYKHLMRITIAINRARPPLTVINEVYASCHFGICSQLKCQSQVSTLGMCSMSSTWGEGIGWVISYTISFLMQHWTNCITSELAVITHQVHDDTWVVEWTDRR